MLVQDERRGFLKAPIIQKIINTMWFTSKNDEDIKQHTLFKPFPLPALVLVLTAVSVILHSHGWPLLTAWLRSNAV